MSELDNIKERFEKVYIVADEDMHKVLGPLKKDIGWLLFELTKEKKQMSDQDILAEWNAGGGVYGDPAMLTISMTKDEYLKFRRSL